MAKNDRVFDEMLCFLSEPIFQIPVRSFMDENCLTFDPETEKSREHRVIFERYKKLIDTLLEAFCEDAKITTEEAIKGISRLNKISDLHDIFYGLFEQVLAATDFNIFYAAMAKRNIMIQEQVLAMIMAQTGALPSSLRREDTSKKSSAAASSPAPAADDKQEEELLRIVMQKSVADKGSKPKREEEEMYIKNAEISQQEAKSLAKDRQQLEQQMQQLVIKSKSEDAVTDQERSTQRPSVPQRETKQGAAVTAAASKAMTTTEAADVWLKSAQSESEAASSSTHTALAASLSQLSPDEMQKRQEFLRQQRDKLLAMKKETREKQLQEVEQSKGAQRPVSARAARSALRVPPAEQNPVSAENEKKMAMRRAIAEKLRQEVVGKQ